MLIFYFILSQTTIKFNTNAAPKQPHAPLIAKAALLGLQMLLF